MLIRRLSLFFFSFVQHLFSETNKSLSSILFFFFFFSADANSGNIDLGYFEHVLPSLWIQNGGNVTISNKLTITNSLRFQFGSLFSPEETGVVLLNGTSSFETGDPKAIFTKVINNGALGWSAGNVLLQDAGTLINSQIGIFTAALTAGAYTLMGDGSSKLQVVNYGLMQQNGPYDAWFAVPVHNNGTLHTSGANLWLGGGGTSFGVFNLSAPVILHTTTSVLANGSQILGSSYVQVYSVDQTIRSVLGGTGTGIYVTGGMAHLLPGFRSLNTSLGTSLAVNGGQALFHYSINEDLAQILVQNGILDTGSVAHKIQRVQQSGGTLTGMQNMTITQSYTASGGTLTGVGRTIIAPSAKLVVSGNSLFTYERTIQNDGLTQWTGTAILANNGATFLNHYNATFEADPNGELTFLSSGSPQSVFVNLGRLTKSRYTYTNIIGLEFANTDASALVDPRLGSLQFAGGGTCTQATFAPQGSGKVEFTAGFHLLETGCQLTGNGTIQFSGAYVNVHANYNSATSPVVSDGTVVFRPGITYSQFGPSINLVSPGGTAVFEAIPNNFPMINIGAGTLDLQNWNFVIPSGVQTGGLLTGGGTVTIAGLYQWYSGQMQGSGTTIFNSTLQLSVGASDVRYSRTLINVNKTNWLSGNVVALDGGLFVNSAGSVFESAQSTGYTWNLIAGATTRFDNFGAFINSGTAKSTIVNVPFQNYNATYAQSAGRLYLSYGSYTSRGSYYALNGGTLAFGFAIVDGSAYINADPSSTIEFASGNNYLYCTYNNLGKTYVTGGYTLFANSGSVLREATYGPRQGVNMTNGLGSSLQASAGTLDLDSWDLTVPTTTLDGSTITGTGTLSVVSLLFKSGAWSGTGVTQIVGNMTINGDNTVSRIIGRLMQNFGTLTWSYGDVTMLDSAIFENTALGTMRMDPSANHNWVPLGNGQASILNYGLLTKSLYTSRNSYQISLNNYALIQVSAGVFSHAPLAGSINYGTIKVDSGSTVEFGTFGSYVCAENSTLTGPGRALFSGATTEVNGLYNITGESQVTNGAVLFKRNTRFVSLGSTFRENGGYTIFEGAPEPVFPPIVLTAGDVDFMNHTFTTASIAQSGGRIFGSNNITVPTFSWSGGQQLGAGSTIVTNTMTINGGSNVMVFLRQIVTTATSTTSWISGTVSSGQTWVNFGSVTILNAGDYYLAVTSPAASTPLFLNYGSLVKLNGGVISFSAQVINYNSILVGGGQLEFQGTATSYSGIVIAGGTLLVNSDFNLYSTLVDNSTLVITGGTTLFSASTLVTGIGSAYFRGGLCNVYGSYSVLNNFVDAGGGLVYFRVGANVSFNSLSVSAGFAIVNSINVTSALVTVSGSGVLQVNGMYLATSTLTWGSGTISGTGNLTAQKIVWSGEGTRQLAIAVLQLNGYSLWQRGNIVGYDGANFVIASTATFDILNFNYGVINYPCYFGKCHRTFYYWYMAVASGTPRLVIYGNVTKSANYRTVHIYWDVVVQPTGTWDVTRASWYMHGGITMYGGLVNQTQYGFLTLTDAKTHTLYNGTMTITGDAVGYRSPRGNLLGGITGNLNNIGGTFILQNTTTITGNFTQGPRGRLVLPIAGYKVDVFWPRLLVLGKASLGGTIHTEITYTFITAENYTFPVMTWGSVSELFAVYSPDPVTRTALTWFPIYTPTGLTLKSHRCPYNCSGNGVCDVASATCSCTGNWMGPSCTDNCADKCSGNGVCVSNGCLCNPPFSGPSCSSSLPPSTLVWTCSANNEWHNASCWDLNFLPRSTDNVTINTGATITIKHSVTVNGLTLVSGTLSYQTRYPLVTVGVLTQSGGAITGSGDLNVTTQFNWNGGSQLGVGTTNIFGLLNMAGGVKTLASRTLNTYGNTTWSSGDLSGNNTSWNNYGSVLVQPGTVAGLGAAGAVAPVFNNYGSYVSYAASNALNWTFNSYGDIEVRSYGNMAFSAGGLSFNTTSVEYNGILQFVGGTFLVLQQGQVLAEEATVQVSNNGKVIVNSTDSYAWSVLATIISGSGNLTLGASNLAEYQNITTDADGLDMPFNQSLTMLGGTFNIVSQRVLSALTIQAGTVTGSASLQVYGPFLWSGGVVDKIDLTVRDQLTLTGAATKYMQGCLLRMNGGAVWEQGELRASQGAIMRNPESFLITTGTAGVSNNSMTVADNSRPKFINYGSITAQNGSANMVSFDVDNIGQLWIQGNSSMIFAGNNYNPTNSSTAVEGGSSLTLASGSHFYAPDSDLLVQPSGLIQFAGASVMIQGVYESASATKVSAGLVTFNTTQFVEFGERLLVLGTGRLQLSALQSNFTLPPVSLADSATLDLQGQLIHIHTLVQSGSSSMLFQCAVTVDGLFSWSGGLVSGPGVLVIASELTLDGATDKQIDDCTLLNLGTITLLKGNLMGTNGAILENPANSSLVINCSADCHFTQPTTPVTSLPLLNNTGEITVLSRPSVTTSIAFRMDNFGLFTCETGSTIKIDGGGIQYGQFLFSNRSNLVLSHSNPLGMGSLSQMPSSYLFLDITSNLTSSAGLNFLIGTFDCAGAITSTGGTLYFARDCVVVNLGYLLTITGGTVGIYTETLDANHYLFPHVILSGTGTFIVPADVNLLSLEMTGGTLQKTGLVRVQGDFQWNSGLVAGSGTIMSLSRLIMDTTGTKTLDVGVLYNDASAVWRSGNVVGTNGAMFWNSINGSLDLQCNSTSYNWLNSAGENSTLVNYGAVTKRSSVANTMQWVIVHMGDQFDVVASELIVTGGGLYLADVQVLSTAALTFNGGLHTVNTSLITSKTAAVNVKSGILTINDLFSGVLRMPAGGTGTVKVYGEMLLSAASYYSGTVWIQGNFSSAVDTVCEGSTIVYTFNSNLESFGPSLTVKSGTVYLQNPRVPEPKVPFVVAGGTLNLAWYDFDLPNVTQTGGVLQFYATLNVENYQFYAGTVTTLNGTILVEDLTFGTTALKIMDNVDIVVLDKATWLAGDIGGSNAALLHITANATLSLASATGYKLYSYSGEVSRLLNEGVVEKPNASTSLEINVIFDSIGLVDVNAGTLSLSGGGTHTGEFSISANATLQMKGGETLFAVESLVNNYGTLLVAAGTTMFDGVLDTFGSGKTMTTGGVFVVQPYANVSTFGSVQVSGTGSMTLLTNPDVDADVVLSGTGVLDYSVLNVTLNSAVLSSSATLKKDGTVTVSGLLKFISGTLDGFGTLKSMDTILFSGSGTAQTTNPIVMRGVLENWNLTRWVSGSVILSNNVLFLNTANGTLRLESVSGQLQSTEFGYLANYGSIEAVATGVQIMAPLDNFASVNLLANSSVQIYSVVKNYDDISAGPRSTLQVVGGSLFLDSNSSLVCTNQLLTTGGVTTVQRGAHFEILGNTEVRGGYLRSFEPAAYFGNPLRVNGGIVYLQTDTEIEFLDVQSGILTGPVTLTVNDTATSK